MPYKQKSPLYSNVEKTEQKIEDSYRNFQNSNIGIT